MSGLHRRLERLGAGCGYLFAGEGVAADALDGVETHGASYADDVTLLGRGRKEIEELYVLAVEFLRHFGLEISLGKCKALIVGDKHGRSLRIGDFRVKGEDRLRFLGVALLRSGHIEPWCEGAAADRYIYASLGALHQAGLAAYPGALIAALRTKILPRLLFGSELFAISEVAGVLFRHKSPYKSAWLT